MSGGNDLSWVNSVNIDQQNAQIAAINNRIPTDIYNPNDLSTYDESKLNAWRDAETKKVLESNRPTDTATLQQVAANTLARENAADRIPDPDYDLTPRDASVYSSVDYSALAKQRAADFADAMEASMKAKGEALSAAERARVIANKQAEEEQRLEDAKSMTDAERAANRDARRLKLLSGKVKLKSGTSLLTADDIQTGSGSLLTG